MLETGDLGDLDRTGRDSGGSADIQLLVDIIDHLKALFPQDKKSAADQWLAPRLHHALRLTRRSASDAGMWTWLAAGPLRHYSEWRWPKDEESESKSKWWRYTSRDLLRNGLARLWWGAELVRTGSDYSLVEDAFKTVRTFQFVSELRYSWHREAARAFARLLRDRNASDAEAQDLSKLFNVYIKTRALELWDHTMGQEALGPDEAWIGEPVSLAEATAPISQLRGPKAGQSNREAEERLYSWLSKLQKGVRH
jgi:hypothetical protein